MQNHHRSTQPSPKHASSVTSYYKQIEQSKAAREKRRVEQQRDSKRVAEKSAASKSRYKLVEPKILESTNISKLVSDEFLLFGQ